MGDQELRQQQAEQEQEHKDFLRTSARLEAWGVALFVFGAIASVLGSTITC